MAAFLIPQQFRNSTFAKHKYIKSMKKVILIDDNNINNKLEVCGSLEGTILVSLGDPSVKGRCNHIELSAEDAFTLREMIDDAISEMKVDRPLDRAMKNFQR